MQLMTPGKPYMIRNDGKVLPCRNFHPYIIDQPNLEDIDYNLFQLLVEYPWQLKWFYQHTGEQSTRDLIEQFGQLIVDIVNADEWNAYDDIALLSGDRAHDAERAIQFLHLTPHYLEDGVTDVVVRDLYDVYELLNVATNQEFLRTRIGGNYAREGGNDTIYFRVSSTEFNWFNTIWSVVAANRSNISKVTITVDVQSQKDPPANTTARGFDYFYFLSGEVVNELPVEEFLTLRGTPVVEDYECAAAAALRRGKPVTECVYSLNDYYKLKANYIKKNFVET